MLELDFVLQQDQPRLQAPFLDFLVPSETGSRSCSITLLDEEIIHLQKMFRTKDEGLRKLYNALDLDRVMDKREVLDLWVLIKAADAIRWVSYSLRRFTSAFVCS